MTFMKGLNRFGVTLNGAGGSGAFAVAHTFDGTTSSYTFAVPQDIPLLQFEMVVQSERLTGTSSILGVRFNGDTGSNYRNQRADAHGTSVAGLNNGVLSYGRIAIGNDAVNLFPTSIYCAVPFHTNSDFPKITHVEANVVIGGTSNDNYTLLYSHWWNDTSPITSVTVHEANGDNFVSGSRLIAYGDLR